MGACCVQDALDILKDGDKQQFLDNLEKWGCVLGKGMDNQMFDLTKCASIYCKIGCKVLMDGYEVLGGWMLETYRLIYIYIYISLYYNSINGIYIYVKIWML